MHACIYSTQLIVTSTNIHRQARPILAHLLVDILECNKSIIYVNRYINTLYIISSYVISLVEFNIFRNIHVFYLRS